MSISFLHQGYVIKAADLREASQRYSSMCNIIGTANAIRLDHMGALAWRHKDDFLEIKDFLLKQEGIGKKRKSINLYDCNACKKFDSGHYVITGYNGLVAIEFFGEVQSTASELPMLKRYTHNSLIAFFKLEQTTPLQSGLYVWTPLYATEHWAKRIAEEGKSVLEKIALLPAFFVHPAGAIVQGPRLQDYIEGPKLHSGALEKWLSTELFDMAIPVKDYKELLLKKAAEIKAA